MATLYCERMLRPSTRRETSPYKIDTELVRAKDDLVVTITHESEPFKCVYRFKGPDIASRKSIHFRAIGNGIDLKIIWAAVTPVSETY